MTRFEIFQKVESENARSKAKYGPWPGNFSSQEQGEAIRREFAEWYKAFIEGDIGGEHGELAELTHVINVAVRRIQYLTWEADA